MATEKELFGEAPDTSELLKFVQDKQTTTPVNNRVSQMGNPSNPDSQTGALADLIKNTDSWGQDKFSYIRPFTYGAGERNVNFDRYYAHPGFKKLGVNPLADNEAIYNEKTSTFDDFQRALPQMGNLFNEGFTSMLNPFSDSQKDAEAYSRAISIGTSSRDGLGAWMSNLGLNAGYTMGIIGEAALEELALTAASFGSFGAAAPVQAAETINIGAKIGRAFDKMGDIFKVVGNANDARKIWNLAKDGTKAVAKFVLPTETLAFANDARGGFKALEEMQKLNGVDKLTDFAKVHKGVGSFVRDLREIKAVVSESGLEGGMVQNDMNEELIHKFYDENGRLPNDQEGQDIYQRSRDAAQHTMLTNLPLIYFSNKLVLGNAMKGFKPVAQLLKEGPRDLGKVFVKDAAGITTAVSKYSLAGIKEGLKPYNLLKGSLRYSTANLAEGLQESSQDVISDAYKDYYDPRYSDPKAAGAISLSDSFAHGINEQFSKQGWDTFASGFFMGGLVQGPQRLIFNKIPQTFSRITNPAQYGEYKKQQENYTNNVVNAKNSMVTAKQKAEWVNAFQDNFVSQTQAADQMGKAESEGDNKGHKDAQDEAIFQHAWTLLSSGREQVITDQLKGLKELTPDELAEAFGRTDGNKDTNNKAIQDKLNGIEGKIEGIKKRYEQAKSLINPFNKKINQVKDPEGYEAQQRQHSAFEFYRKQTVFSQYAFDRTLERMKSIASDFTSDESAPLSKTSMTDFGMLFDQRAMKQEIDALKVEIGVGESNPANDKALLKQKKARLAALQDFNHTTTGYTAALNLRAAMQVKPETKTKVEQQTQMTSGVEVITKAGRKLKVTDVHRDGQRVRLADNKLYKLSGLKLAEAKPADEAFDIDAFVAQHIGAMKDAYTGYVRHVATTNADHVIDSRVNASFDKIKDYYALHHDSFKMAEAINFLTNPERTGEIVSRYAEARKELEAQREEKLRDGLKTFLEQIGHNDLLNALHKIGVFIEPEFLDKFINENVIPERFISETGLGEITKTDPKYKQIEDVLVKFNLIVRPEKVEKMETNKAEAKEKAEKKKTKTPEEVAKKAMENLFPKLQARFDKVKTGEDLDNLDRDLVMMLQTNMRDIEYSGLTPEILREMVKAKKLSMRDELVWDDIREGNVVQANDLRYGLMRVVYKDKNMVKLQILSDDKTILTVPKNKLKETINYKQSEVEKPEMTPEEKKNANTNKENNTDFMEDDAAKTKVFDEADKKSKDDVDNDFINDIGCK